MEFAPPLLPKIALNSLSGGMCVLNITALEDPEIFRLTPATWTLSPCKRQGWSSKLL